MLKYVYLLHGCANIDYFQEGETGLIAAPVEVHKTCSQMFMFIDIHVCRCVIIPKSSWWYNIAILHDRDTIACSECLNLYLLHGCANIDYFQEGAKGLIADPVDAHKTCSQMFTLIDIHVCRCAVIPKLSNCLFQVLGYPYLLHGCANINYFEEGEQGLIAAPVDVHKPCSQMSLFIDIMFADVL